MRKLLLAMESRQQDEESAQGFSADDAKTIVTALTQLLLDEPSETLNTVNASSAPGFSSIGTSTGNSSLEMQRPSSSSVDANETLPLPGFLADSQVRMALCHAASLHLLNIHVSRGRERRMPALLRISILLLALPDILPHLTCLLLLSIHIP